jgi:RNA ligase (TIGR02306 family)
MRKLASIQKIDSLTPIPKADAIECATVLGWHVVVKKGEYKVGDRVVYIEIDSLLPERPEFEFLRPSYKPAIVNAAGETLLRAGFRVRTVKLRGQVSQGICFPLSILPDVLGENENSIALTSMVDVGTDVTDVLGIVKYEIPEELGGVRLPGLNAFPSGIPKTDETRVQNLGGLLHACRGKQFVRTEKLDGSSFTAFVHGEEFGVCSRNLKLDPNDTTHHFCALAAKLDIAAKMRALQSVLGDFAIQGEVCGPGIQKNKYELIEHRLFVFDVFYLGTSEYAFPDKTRSLVAEMGLDSVPMLGEFTLNHSIDEVVDLSIGKSVLNPKIEREGIVLRPVVPAFDDQGNRISFKAINPKFLLAFDV